MNVCFVYLPYLQLLRPSQWLKNIFIFLPLFFNGHIFEISYFIQALLVYVAFSLAASSIYCFNDIIDVESDRQHTTKRLRPIASGKVSKKSGYMIMLLCLMVSIFLTFSCPWSLSGGGFSLMTVLVLYLLMNFAYCIYLKHIAIVDVFVISAGFVLRVLAGGLSTGIFLSHWILLMTFLLALFLAFAKRRDDVIIYEDTNKAVRQNINRYNLDFLNQAIAITASVIMVCYIMYTVSPEVCNRFSSNYVYITSVFVLAGIMRYLQLTIVDMKSGSPTFVLTHDRFVQLCIMGWICTFLLIIYI